MKVRRAGEQEKRKLFRHWELGLHCIGSLRAVILEGKQSRRCSVVLWSAKGGELP
jgi:hypothetical protein